MAPPHTAKGNNSKKTKAAGSSPAKQQSQATSDGQGKNAKKKKNKIKKQNSNAGVNVQGRADVQSKRRGKVGKIRQRGGRSLARGRAAKQARHAQIPNGAAQPPNGKTSEQRSLLTLPKEIRRTIFTMAVQEDDHIQVTPSLKPPALLAVSHQTRDEATKLWAQANIFCITIDRFDTKLLLAWSRFTRELGSTAVTQMSVDESHNWANLLQWARHVQQGRYVMVPATGEHVSAGHAVANATVGIATSMIGRPWGECKVLLEKFRLALEKLDHGWM